MHRDKERYYVQLLAYLPAESECKPDPLPFQLEIPLDTVNLPYRSYPVNVNGAGPGFQFPSQP